MKKVERVKLNVTGTINKHCTLVDKVVSHMDRG